MEAFIYMISDKIHRKRASVNLFLTAAFMFQILFPYSVDAGEIKQSIAAADKNGNILNMEVKNEVKWIDDNCIELRTMPVESNADALNRFINQNTPRIKLTSPSGETLTYYCDSWGLSGIGDGIFERAFGFKLDERIIPGVKYSAVIEPSDKWIVKGSLSISKKVSEIPEIYYNNEKKVLGNNPFIENENAMLPLKDIMDFVKGELKTDSTFSLISVKYGQNEINLFPESNAVKSNGSEIKLDQPTTVKNGCVYVSSDFINRVLGLKIEWDKAYNRIRITNPFKLQYAIDIINPSSGTARIKIEISNITDKEVVLEGYINGSIKPAVVDEKNKSLSYKRQGNYWIINTNSTSCIKINYDVTLRSIIDNEYKGYIGKDFGIFTGGQMLLYPKDVNKTDRNVQIRFTVPKGTSAVTPWPIKNNVYYPNLNLGNEYEDYKIGNFISAGFGYGKFDIYSGKVGNTLVKVVMPKTWSIQRKNGVSKGIYSLLDYFGKLFGKSFSDQYMVIYSHAAHDGRSIWAGEWTAVQATSAVNDYKYDMIAHQMFHRWNGWMWGYDRYFSDDLGILLKEGIVRYYEAKSIGSVSENLYGVTANQKTFIKILYDRYLKENKSKGYVNPVTGYYSKSYEYGTGICFGLDMQIINDTAGKKSLDDVIKILFNNYWSKKNAITRKDLIDVIKTVTGKDYTAFFNNYVSGTQTLDMKKYLIDSDRDGKLNYYEIITK